MISETKLVGGKRLSAPKNDEKMKLQMDVALISSIAYACGDCSPYIRIGVCAADFDARRNDNAVRRAACPPRRFRGHESASWAFLRVDATRASGYFAAQIVTNISDPPYLAIYTSCRKTRYHISRRKAHHARVSVVGEGSARALPGCCTPVPSPPPFQGR